WEGEAVELPEEEGEGLAAPAAAQQAEGPGCLRRDPADQDLDPAGAQAPAGAPGPAQEGLDATLLEALGPAGDGASGAEQNGGDNGPGVARGQEQDEVGAQAQLGVEVRAVAVQEGIAFIGRQLDTTRHGLVLGVNRLVVHHSP